MSEFPESTVRIAVKLLSIEDVDKGDPFKCYTFEVNVGDFLTFTLCGWNLPLNDRIGDRMPWRANGNGPLSPLFLMTRDMFNALCWLAESPHPFIGPVINLHVHVCNVLAAAHQRYRDHTSPISP